MPVRYDDFDWTATREAHRAFWAGDLGRPLLLLSGRVKGPHVRRNQQRYIPAYGDLPIADIVDIAHENLRTTWYAGDGYPEVFTNYGAGSVAAYVGLADADYSETGGVWFRAATDVELRDLHVEPRMDTHWLVHTDAYMRAMVERLGPRTQITLPDLGGMLDILASIRTTEHLLTDLIDWPDQVERLLGEILAAWWVYYDHFHNITKGRCPGTKSWAPVWSPGRTYMFQSDFAYMIGPDMFERFVVPELTACCRRVDHSFYHLDGVGQLAHLDLLLGIEGLCGIQWVPGEGKKNPCQWPEVFRKILASGKYVQTWALSPDEVFDVIRYTGGARGVIFEVRGVEEDEADAYVAEVLRAVRAAR